MRHRSPHADIDDVQEAGLSADAPAGRTNRLAVAAASRGVAPRDVSPVPFHRFEDSGREIFTAFGMDADTPRTAETPGRCVQELHDATAGYDGVWPGAFREAELRQGFLAEVHDRRRSA